MLSSAIKRRFIMADDANKLPVKNDVQARSTPPAVPALRDEINRLFDEFDFGFGRWPMPRSFFGGDVIERARANVFAVDIAETDKAFEVTAELPGMAEADIAVDLVNGDLRIKGEKKEEKEEKKKDYYLSERRFGSFERRFHVPEGVDTDKIEAAFSKGVLKVTMPKAKAAAPKRVEIKNEK
jgi:HSP20 family protein